MWKGIGKWQAPKCMFKVSTLAGVKLVRLKKRHLHSGVTTRCLGWKFNALEDVLAEVDQERVVGCPVEVHCRLDKLGPQRVALSLGRCGILGHVVELGQKSVLLPHLEMKDACIKLIYPTQVCFSRKALLREIELFKLVFSISHGCRMHRLRWWFKIFSVTPDNKFHWAKKRQNLECSLPSAKFLDTICKTALR